MIRLLVTYPDDCPPSVLAFATPETATRVGEAMERLYPGAVADVEWWCAKHRRWEGRCCCIFCGYEVCEQACETDGDDAACFDCLAEDEANRCSCVRGCVRCVGVSANGPI